MRKFEPQPLLQQLASGPGLSPQPHIRPTKYRSSMKAMMEPRAMFTYHLDKVIDI